MIRAALPWTIGLVGMATIISFALGTLLGIVAAWRRGSWLDNLLPAITFFQAAPYFFVAILMVALFATKLGWFPQNSGYDITALNPSTNWPYISSVLDHAVLPALTAATAGSPASRLQKKCIKRPSAVSNKVEGGGPSHKGNDMATKQTSEVFYHLRRAALLQDGAGMTDGQLLTEYLRRREEAALAALVRRHGPLVFGVCRNVLRHEQDAEDAFQATFLTLARKAYSIRNGEALAASAAAYQLPALVNACTNWS